MAALRSPLFTDPLRARTAEDLHLGGMIPLPVAALMRPYGKVFPKR